MSKILVTKIHIAPRNTVLSSLSDSLTANLTAVNRPVPKFALKIALQIGSDTIWQLWIILKNSKGTNSIRRLIIILNEKTISEKNFIFET